MALSLRRLVPFSTWLVLGLGLLLEAPPAWAFIGSEASLEVSASRETFLDGRANTAIFLQFNVPLDPRRPASVHGGLLQEEETTPVEDVPLDALERDQAEPAGKDQTDSAWGEAVSSGAELVEPLMLERQFLSDLTQAALLAQGCDDAWSRLEHLGTRNRASALLPDVALRAGRERDTALRLTPTDADPYRYTMSGATNLLLEGRLSWRLGRLLFSTEDLGLERLRLARSRERQRVVERTMAVLFQWLRAQSELAPGKRLTARQLRTAKWERVQAEMRLDVLSGGWFSAHYPATVPARAAGRESESSKPSAPTAAEIAPQAGARVPSKTQEGERPLPHNAKSPTTKMRAQPSNSVR